MNPTRRTVLGLSAAGLTAAVLAACSSSDADTATGGGGGGSGDLVTIGFVAVGPEGAWRQDRKSVV